MQLREANETNVTNKFTISALILLVVTKALTYGIIPLAVALPLNLKQRGDKRCGNSRVCRDLSL